MRCIQTRPSTSRSTTAHASKPRKYQTEKRAGTDAPLPRETVSFAHLCRSYADRPPLLHFLSSPNRGHTILRATCVPRARGGALDNRVDRSSSWGGSMCLRGRSISGRRQHIRKRSESWSRASCHPLALLHPPLHPPPSFPSVHPGRPYVRPAAPESTRHLPASSPSMCAFHLSPVLTRRSPSHLRITFPSRPSPHSPSLPPRDGSLPMPIAGAIGRRDENFWCG
ncbi:hypothetical protein B0H11DRAFT_2058921 [Mycena galericulata]|nr:hypothetical protein B0H11DRAFT_2058921 [Mycena galericulata]